MKDNKLIAEFRGGILSEDSKDFFFRGGFQHHSNILVEKLEYHSSWDWLMPVVRKINESGYPMCGTLLAQKVYQACGIAQIELVYKAVVEFIKWYNKQK